MMAATTMISHAGEMFAKRTPSVEVQAPAIPMARPSLGIHVFSRRCVMRPDTDVGMMANSDVAVETTAERPNTKRNSGIITVPPPTPSIPESTPTPTPAMAISANAPIENMLKNPISSDSHGDSTTKEPTGSKMPVGSKNAHDGAVF